MGWRSTDLITSNIGHDRKVGVWSEGRCLNHLELSHRSRREGELEWNASAQQIYEAERVDQSRACLIADIPFVVSADQETPVQ